LKNIEVSGIQISDYRKRAPELMATCYRELFELVANGDITPPLGSTLPLSEWASALQMIESRVAAGRLVLVPER
jgi:NADPH2:quinone reductase